MGCDDGTDQVDGSAVRCFFYREEELTVGREGACRTVTVGGGETCRDNRRSEETLQRSVKSRFQSDQLIVQPSSSQFLSFPWGPLGSKVLELLGGIESHVGRQSCQRGRRSSAAHWSQ